MNDKDIKQLIDLANKLMKERTSKEEAMESFVAAGILTENGNFTKPYNELKSIIIEQA